MGRGGLGKGFGKHRNDSASIRRTQPQVCVAGLWDCACGHVSVCLNRHQCQLIKTITLNGRLLSANQSKETITEVRMKAIEKHNNVNTRAFKEAGLQPATMYIHLICQAAQRQSCLKWRHERATELSLYDRFPFMNRVTVSQAVTKHTSYFYFVLVHYVLAVDFTLGCVSHLDVAGIQGESRHSRWSLSMCCLTSCCKRLIGLNFPLAYSSTKLYLQLWVENWVSMNASQEGKVDPEYCFDILDVHLCQ